MEPLQPHVLEQHEFTSLLRVFHYNNIVDVNLPSKGKLT